jgi:RNA polymerase sigma-70 factor (ECF subfamily)
MKENKDDRFFVNELTKAQAKMRAYVAKLLALSSSTDDVLQECNQLLWVKRAEWDPDTIFLKWAYRVCYFKAMAYCRDQSREKLVFNPELLEMMGQETPDEYTQSSREIAMEQCLAKLKEASRELLLERYRKNFSVEELATREGLTANALSQKLLRLRYKLHHCIQENLKPNPAQV